VEEDFSSVSFYSCTVHPPPGCALNLRSMILHRSFVAEVQMILPPETFLHQLGYPAAVINVCMGKNEDIHFFGSENKRRIVFINIMLTALEHAAVKENFEAVIKNDHMRASGDYPIGPTEFYLHLVYTF
jgi:hypothetical protein